MKYIITLLIITTVITFANAQIGIGTVSPDSSSILEIKSTSKGILIPRMTKFQRISILNPKEGLLIYQNDDLKGFWFFDGIEWKNISIHPKLTKLQRESITNPIEGILVYQIDDVKGYWFFDGVNWINLSNYTERKEMSTLLYTINGF